MKNKISLFIILTLFSILNVLNSNNFFFWDTILLGSKQAHFFYENNFSKIILPDEIDSGHIPLFGIYLAILWKLFGKSLFISHIAILPFTLGIILQTYRLLSKILPSKYVIPALLIVVLDPTFVAQSTLVTPDIILLFSFLMVLNSIFENNKTLFIIASIPLALISNRGAMLLAVLYIFYLLLNINKKKSVVNFFITSLRNSYLVIPATMLFLSYQIPHYILKGWIGYTEDFAWAESFEKVSLMEFFKGIIIWGWRLIDFGRIIFYFIIPFILIKHYKTILRNKNFINWAILLTLLIISFSYSFLFFKNLKGHRYLLPMYFVISIIFSFLFFKYISNNILRNSLLTLIIVFLTTGHLWVYPEKISQGWSASLAHLPYYELRDSLVKYIEHKKYKMENIGSFFPNLAEEKYTHLTDRLRKFKEAQIPKDTLVFYSNVYNVEDNTLDSLWQHYSVEKIYKLWKVYVCIYRLKK